MRVESCLNIYGPELWALVIPLLLISACVRTSPWLGDSNPPAVADATARPSARSYWECDEGKAECHDSPDDWLARLEVPPGFTVSLVGQLPPEVAPTSISYGPDGRLYVATIAKPFEERFNDAIYVLDEGETPLRYAVGFLLPVGLAFQPATSNLYVSSRAGRFEGKISVVEQGRGMRDIVTGLPCCYTGMEHQPNGLTFGPDGLLYLAMGARTDHGEAL